MEEWKDISEYEGLYQISNYGRVRSMDRLDRLGRKNKGRLRSGYVTKAGYRMVDLWKLGVRSKFSIHRLVMREFYGPSDLCVNHKDSDRLNNKLENLEYCTHKQNTQHAIKTGSMTFKSGEAVWSSTLTEEQVKSIKTDLIYKMKQKDIAALFGVSKSNIANIKNEATWKHIDFCSERGRPPKGPVVITHKELDDE